MLRGTRVLQAAAGSAGARYAAGQLPPTRPEAAPDGRGHAGPGVGLGAEAGGAAAAFSALRSSGSLRQAAQHCGVRQHAGQRRGPGLRCAPAPPAPRAQARAAASGLSSPLALRADGGAGFLSVVRQGLAADGGLYVPRDGPPTMSLEEWGELLPLFAETFRRISLKTFELFEGAPELLVEPAPPDWAGTLAAVPDIVDDYFELCYKVACAPHETRHLTGRVQDDLPMTSVRAGASLPARNAPRAP